MGRHLAAFVVLMVALVATTYAACKFNDYDFSKMSTLKAVGKYAYAVNLCKETSCSSMKGVGVCQTVSKELYNCGSLATAEFKKLSSGGDGFIATLKGSKCKAGGSRTSVITATCDEGNKEGTLKVTNEKGCEYDLSLKADFACSSSGKSSGSKSKGSKGSKSKSKSKSKGSSSGKKSKKGGFDGGWIFIIILVCCIVVYLAAGMAWNYKRNEARGVEMTPNLEFWKDLPGLVKDGNIYFVQKVSGGRLCADYQPI